MQPTAGPLKTMRNDTCEQLPPLVPTRIWYNCPAGMFAVITACCPQPPRSSSAKVAPSTPLLSTMLPQVLSYIQSLVSQVFSPQVVTV